MATVLLQGQEINTNGELPAVGSAAPPFTLADQDLRDATLDDYRGHTLIISVVPSLDTPTCLVSTRRLSEQVEELPGARLLVVSADLPFAQGRILLEHEIGNAVALSMMRDREFAIDYGLLIVDGPLRGIAARALLVVDPGGTVVYAELVPDIADEPDYAAAVAAVSTVQTG